MKNSLENKYFPAKKQLGQNFLTDLKITDRIIETCELKPEETVLEIGAGLGALTGRIAERVSQVIAVETDRRLVNELQEQLGGKNVSIVHADFLKYDLSSLPGKLKVIGNLPYYISSPIIGRILENREHFSSLYITVQYEFGQRMISRIGTKDYSAFTCFVQYYAAIKMLFRIPNAAFHPVPKVHSCFMKLDIHPQPLVPARDEEFLFSAIRQAFQQRRKTILNSLSALIDKEKLTEAFETLKIDPKARAENLTISDFVRLANYCGQ